MNNTNILDETRLNYKNQNSSNNKNNSENASRHNTAQNQSLQDNVNLKTLFQTSAKKPLRLSFRYLSAFLGVLVGCLVMDHYLVSNIENDPSRDVLQSAMIVLIAGSFLAWVIKYWFIKIQDRFLKYSLRDGSIVITKGIFLKKRGSFHLTQVTDVYLAQEQLDWFFNTCSLCISTPNEASGKFAFIEGFDRSVGLRLQQYLLQKAGRAAQRGRRTDYVINESNVPEFEVGATVQ